MKFKNFIREMDVDLSTAPGADVTASAPVVQAPPAQENPPDVIRMDVPLFIRMMEYAKENAKTDQELHQMTERAAAMSHERSLTMEDYESLVAELRQQPDDPNAAPPSEYATMTKDPASDSDVPTDPKQYGGQTAG